MYKYYEITKEEADKIGYYKVSIQHHIDAKAGRLKNGNFALYVNGLYGLTKINGVDLKNKTGKVITNFVEAEI